MSRREDLFTHAADLLDIHAQMLRDCMTTAEGVVWSNPAAKADHDDCVNTAQSLRAYSEITTITGSDCRAS